MSKGLSGLYAGTKGNQAAIGSTIFMTTNEVFVANINKRADVDTNGFYDIIAHSSPNSVKIVSNGRAFEVSHRVLARLLKSDKNYKGGNIRLLSCNTGNEAGQFAQNLANKLGVLVKAPTQLLWAWPNGRYCVAKGRNGNTITPDLTQKGYFKTFYPGKGNQ